MKFSYSRSFWVLAACEAVLAAGYALSMPFLAVYLSVKKGLPPAMVGMFLSFSVLLTSAAMAIAGEWSDMAGRKKVMMFSLFSRAVLIGLMALVVAGDKSWVWLIMLHIIGGFAGVMFNPAAHGWIADTVGHTGRMQAYGFLRIGINFGWAVGPAMGGFLALKSYPLMFSVTSGAYFAALLFIFVWVKDSQSRRHEESMSLKKMSSCLADKRFLRFCRSVVMIASVMSQLVVSLSLYAVGYLGLDANMVGILFSINGIVVVLFQYGIGKFLSKFRITLGIALGCLCYCAGYSTVGFSNGFWAAAAGVFILSLGEAAVAPGMHALAANLAPKGCKGRYLGVQGVSQQIGSSLGILLGTAGIQFLSPIWRPAPWCCAGVMAVAAAVGFMKLGKSIDISEDGVWKEDASDIKEL